MTVEYSNNQIRKICTDANAAIKKHGVEMASRIHQRIDEITAAESAEQMVQFKIGRCHPLHGNRKQQYAVDLVHPYRLIFTAKGEVVQIAIIQEIVDYH